MTPQEFLKQNRYNLSPEEYNAALDDLSNMDNASWGKKYNDIFSEKTTGWYELKQQFKPLPKRFVSSFGTSDRTNPFDRPKAELDDIYRKDYADVPREQFDSMLKNMSQYWEDEKKARTYEAGRTRREKETRDWGKSDILTTPWMRNLLASEYEKRRYIENPEEAIFGEETPEFGKAKDTRWASMGDVGLGALAVGADVGTSLLKTNPLTFGISVGAGPTIRGIRDVAYKVSDSPYQKEWGDIASDFGSDVASNAAIEGFANLRNISRGIKNLKNESGAIATSMENARLINETKKSLDALPTRTELKDMTNAELWKRIDEMPEGMLKSNLKKYADNIYTIDRAGIADELDRASELVDIFEIPGKKETIISNIEKDVEAYPKIGERAYESKIITEKPLTPLEKLGKGALTVVEKIPDKAGGAMKAATQFPGAKAVEENPELIKDWYKQNYERDWNMGFKPKAKEGDLKWEAYKEWYVNKYGTLPSDEEE